MIKEISVFYIFIYINIYIALYFTVHFQAEPDFRFCHQNCQAQPQFQLSSVTALFGWDSIFSTFTLPPPHHLWPPTPSTHHSSAPACLHSRWINQNELCQLNEGRTIKTHYFHSERVLMVLLLFIWPSSFCLIHCRSKYLLLYGTLWYNMVLYGTIMVCVDQLFITISFNLSWLVYNFDFSFLILTNLSIPSTLLPRATCRGYLFIYFVKIYSIIKYIFSFCFLYVFSSILPFPTTSTKYALFLAVLDHLQSTFIKL